MSVWDYATKRKNSITKDLEGQCQHCNKIIKCVGNSTTTLKNHLQNHGISLTSTSKSRSGGEKSQKIIADFLKERMTLKEIISDLATDGISIRAITRNKYIRQSVARDGFKLPANESDVMKLLHEDFDEKQKIMMDTIKLKVANGVKFSMTVDEVTTLRGRRYFGVNLHDKTEDITYKTGLIRIFGSCNALNMVEIMNQHLSQFGISMKKDLVASTQDGASVNKKYIQHIDVIGQFCLNHGLHLGVCDTLYKKKISDDTEDLSDFCDDGREENDFFDEMDIEILNTSENEDNIDYHSLLTNSRKLIKYIKLSTVRNQVFQTKNKALFGREIELHLDVKTRWNSIPTMLEPLIKTQSAIRETLLEFNANSDLIDNINFDALKDLLDAMKPIKLAVENLSREDSTLMSADTILKFMFEKLSFIKSDISKKLMENLKIRIDERLNTDVMDLLRSLKSPEIPPSRAALNFAGTLASRLFGVNDETDTSDKPADNSTTTEIEMSLQEELNLLLKKNILPTTANAPQDKFKWLKAEFTLYKNTGKRTENLEKILDALLTIKPTSTDVERVFSVCANFCTKIRSRLSDKSLSALVFLNYYYKTQKK